MNKLIILFVFLLYCDARSQDVVVDPEQFMKPGIDRDTQNHLLIRNLVKATYGEKKEPKLLRDVLIKVLESGLIDCGDKAEKLLNVFSENCIKISESRYAVPTDLRARVKGEAVSGPARQWFLIAELEGNQIQSVEMVYRSIKEID